MFCFCHFLYRLFPLFWSRDCCVCTTPWIFLKGPAEKSPWSLVNQLSSRLQVCQLNPYTPFSVKNQQSEMYHSFYFWLLSSEFFICGSSILKHASFSFFRHCFLYAVDRWLKTVNDIMTPACVIIPSTPLPVWGLEDDRDTFPHTHRTSHMLQGTEACV